MSPLIGIIMRNSISEEQHQIATVYEDIIDAVLKSGGVPIGIPNKDIAKYISICSGFIVQGGDDIANDDLIAIKLIKEKNIPILGICLGMQEMAYLANGEIYDINNHKIEDMHEIEIVKDSLLYRILGCEKTMVNSRHKSAVKNTNLKISATSPDGIIEAVEDSNNTFFLGLQWHPENMYEYDRNSRKIFDYFIKTCHH